MRAPLKPAPPTRAPRNPPPRPMRAPPPAPPPWPLRASAVLVKAAAASSAAQRIPAFLNMTRLLLRTRCYNRRLRPLRRVDLHQWNSAGFVPANSGTARIKRVYARLRCAICAFTRVFDALGAFAHLAHPTTCESQLSWPDLFRPS